MDGQLSRKKVIGSPIYEESLERTFVEGIERFGMFQARKYLEHILNTVEKLENDYPYYPECRHLTTKSRMYRNIILDSHLIIYRNLALAQRLQFSLQFLTIIRLRV